MERGRKVLMHDPQPLGGAAAGIRADRVAEPVERIGDPDDARALRDLPARQALGGPASRPALVMDPG